MNNGTDGHMTKKDFSSDVIWKFASIVLGYLIMGFWMAAKISAGYEVVKEEITSVKMDIKSLSQRMDQHIDQTK